MSNFLNSILSIFRGSSNLPQQLQDYGIRTTGNAASIQFQNRAGQQIALNESNVVIRDTNGNIITLDAAGIHIQSSSTLTIDSSQLVINSPMVKASGVIQCDTLIANSVVGSSYTPGTGNVW
jgi:hypothetical protein